MRRLLKSLLPTLSFALAFSGASADDGCCCGLKRIPGCTTSTFSPEVNGYVRCTDASYPGACGLTQVNVSGTTIDVKRSYTGVLYDVSHGVLTFDTSGLPDSATVQSAQILLTSFFPFDGDGRSVVMGWFDPDSESYETFVFNSNNDAHAGTSLSVIGDDERMAYALQNLTNVDKAGLSGLRIWINGGQPTDFNEVYYATTNSFEPPSEYPVLMIAWCS